MSTWATRTVHKTVRVAIHPGWQHTNGDNLLDDVAIIQMDAPAAGITPVTLGVANVPQATILGPRPVNHSRLGRGRKADVRRRAARCRAAPDQ